MRNLLPENHPDIDELFKNDTRVLPEWHIDLTDLLFVSQMEKIAVPRGHPNPQKMYLMQEVPPKNHPMITSLLEPYLPPGHPLNLDEMLRNPGDFPLPNFHPSLARFLLPQADVKEETDQEEQLSKIQDSGISEPAEEQVTLENDSYTSGDNDLSGKTDSSYDTVTTDDYDSLFIDNLEEAYYVPTFSVFFDHPELGEDYEIGAPVKHHPSVHNIFEKYLPDNHPNIDLLMARGFVLPSYHPDIRSIVQQRSLLTSPASLLSYVIASIVVFTLIVQNASKLKRRTEVVPPPPKPLSIDQSFEATLGSYESEHDYDDSVIIHDDSNDETQAAVGREFECALPSLNQRRHHALVMNQDHHDENLGPREDVRENILAYREKKTTKLGSKWNNARGKRVIKSNSSVGEVINCVLYVVVNLAALVTSPTYNYPIGLGSLSAGNTLFLVMTA